jgi:hypothetical protein
MNIASTAQCWKQDAQGLEWRGWLGTADRVSIFELPPNVRMIRFQDCGWQCFPFLISARTHFPETIPFWEVVPMSLPPIRGGLRANRELFRARSPVLGSWAGHTWPFADHNPRLRWFLAVSKGATQGQSICLILRSPYLQKSPVPKEVL